MKKRSGGYTRHMYTSISEYSAEREYACRTRGGRRYRQQRFPPGVPLPATVSLSCHPRARAHASSSWYYGFKTPYLHDSLVRRITAKWGATLRASARSGVKEPRKRGEGSESARSVGHEGTGGGGTCRGGRRRDGRVGEARARAAGEGCAGRGKELCLPAVRPQCALRDITGRSCVCHSHVHIGTVRSPSLTALVVLLPPPSPSTVA